MSAVVSREAAPDGWRRVHFDSIDSTNAEAVRQAKAGAPGGLAISASRQTAGRGRSGRQWSTEGDDLALTLLLRPDRTPAEGAAIGFVAALGVFDMATDLLPAGAPLTIKWPNDVLVGRGKLSGILAEAAAGAGGKLDWLALGVGVNLAPKSRPGAPNAVDIVTAGGPRLSTEAAADRLLESLSAWIDVWLDEGFGPIRDAWRERARDLGRDVIARLPNETVHGRALDLGPDGALLLRLEDGRERSIAAGDVFPAQESA